MKFRKTHVAGVLTILFLSLAGNILFMSSGTKAVNAATDYIPIKWALIVLGGFDYYKHPPTTNAIQKVEHWIQSDGVPYDIIEDDNIEPPTETPSSRKYPLQYANGTIRYGVFVILMNNYLDTSAANINYIYWAVSNGTNAIIFGTAAKYVPALLSISASDVSYFVDHGINQINCIIHKTFSDGIIEYQQGTNQTIGDYYQPHGNISNTVAKTVWYEIYSNTGKHWIGMMSTTYGSGKVFWNEVAPEVDTGDYTFFGNYGTFSQKWEKNNFKFIAHAINFMFNQVERINIRLMGYKRWGGAIVHRLDQDSYVGLESLDETALKAGWTVDQVICALGYVVGGGSSLQNGLPPGYTGSPSIKTKHGEFTKLVVPTQPLRYTSRMFIVYNSTEGGDYDRMKVDWNNNQDFTDDIAYKVWENQTHPSVRGTYYWCYCDNFTEPADVRLSWWCPLRDRISDFTKWKMWGQKGYVVYGFHSWQHGYIGTGPLRYGNNGVYHMWNGTHFILNQTWIEQKFTEARNELAYCLGSSGYGFEADKVLVSHAGNEYRLQVDKALHNLDYVYLTYGDNSKNEPGWFLYSDRKPAMTCGGGEEKAYESWRIDAWIDAVKTLFPIFGIYEHNWGNYNLTFNVYPPDTAYTDMFCFAHLDESFEFWFNSRYMWTSTVNAYYKDNKIVLEYRANNTLKDYVWRFPIMNNGRYFNGFSDNRTMGKIKHIDGKYVYIEFSEGGNERLEATYGPYPHIYQTSSYIENITQIYSPKNLTLQLWNTSGAINIEVNCTRLGQPNSIKINGALTNFVYNPTTKICSFNVTFNSLETVELLWERAPPDPPALVSPTPASRFDPSKSLTLAWEFSDPDTGDSQSAYRFQLSEDFDFTSPIIDTGKVISPITQTTQTLPSKGALYYWRVGTWDNRDAEGEWSGGRYIIVDKLIVTITPRATTVTVGTQVDFTVTAIYAYDNERVPEFTVNILRDGAHFAANNFTDTSNIESTHQYTIENITERTYGLTAFASNSSTVTWTPKSFSQPDWTTSNALILIPIIPSVLVVLTYLLIRERRKHKNTQVRSKKARINEKEFSVATRSLLLIQMV